MIGSTSTQRYPPLLHRFIYKVPGCIAVYGVAFICYQPLPVIDHAKFLKGIQSNVAVRANTPMATKFYILLHAEDTVTQVAFGGWTQHYIGFGGCQLFQFFIIQVC